jgi:hypothetical protein
VIPMPFTSIPPLLPWRAVCYTDRPP